MLEKLACNLGRNDEEPNIALAHTLCNENDTNGIEEIRNGLKGKDKAVANDCIKVLYEIGVIKPELIAGFASDFLSLLLSKNNRLAWGGMTALATIADLKADEIFSRVGTVIQAYETGSVITIDNSMTIFAKLSRANKSYQKELFPLLVKHLQSCRPKEVAQHAERILICIDKQTAKEYVDILENRKIDLNASQTKRVDKLIKQIKQNGFL